MDILKLIKERRTIRRYKDKPVPKKVIDKIIEAGRWGPSPHNSQPWRFVIIRSESFKERLLKELKKPPRSFLTSVNIFLKQSIDIINSTPLLILVYNNGALSKRVKRLGNYYFSIAHISEIEGISASLQNMQLTASSLRLGMAWLTMPLFVRKRINKIVNSGDELVAVLTLGYPDEKGKRAKRKPLTEVVSYIK